MSQSHFIERDCCPACKSQSFEEIISLPYSDKSLENYLKNFYNSQGKILLSNVLNKNSENINLDVSQFKSGIYFIKVHSKNNLYTKKVQIIR